MGRKEKGREREEGKKTDRRKEGVRGKGKEDMNWSPQNAIFTVLTSKASKLTSSTKSPLDSWTLYFVLLQPTTYTASYSTEFCA